MLHEGILGIHSLMRWILLGLLFINIFRITVESKEEYDETDKKFSFWITLFTWLNIVSAFDLYILGPNGIMMIRNQGYSLNQVMNSSWLRFWIIEHPIMMLIAMVLIIVSHSVSLKNMNAKNKLKLMNFLYIIAIVIIIVAVPWPFRLNGIARPAFRALY